MMIKQLHWRWILLLAVLALIALFIFLRIYFKKESETHIERPVIQAQVIIPTLEELSILREVPGNVVSAYEATLASKISGLVEEIRVKEGNRVKAGEVLIILDSRDLKAQLQQAQAEFENATVHYQRMRQLFAQESVARQELDNAERTYKVAEAAKNIIEANLTYTVIKAPFDGVITDKIIEVGEMATPGRPLLRLEDNQHLRLEVTVAATDIGAIRPGEKVEVKLDALGEETLMGHVAKILPAADPSTHTVTVKVDLPWQPGLRSGLFGKMILPVGSRKVLIIPLSAVLQKADLALVYVVNESGIIQARFIRLGKIHQDRVEVLSGLEPGEKILAYAQEGLEGMRIQSVPGASQ